MIKPFFPFLVAGITLGCAAQAQTSFPTDFDPTACPVDSTLFNSWFASGTATAGGGVMPADSLTFPPVDNTACDFYRWGAQMFLWITSPEEGTIVLDSDQFLDVVETSSGSFVYEDNSGAATPNNFAMRDRKPESMGGTGQAGGSDVLISQEGSLTYYGIHTNDIYADYLKGQTSGVFNGTSIAENFPTTAADMQLIEQYVGTPLRDPEAMTMELKTSWVDAATVDASQFITISATVPTFDRSSDTTWPMTGTEAMTLALVGVHIAAPVNGHPELVWSSFEHLSAAPTAPYYYLNTSGTPTQRDFDSAGNWVFFPAGSPQPSSVLTVASWDSSDSTIQADEGKTISPVSVVQENPWGLAPDDTSTAAANTDLVNLNANLVDALKGLGDVRGNYLQIGGIWTVTGQLPTGADDTNIRGGTRLANATMETFHQYPDTNNGFQSRNCFFCHSTSGTSGLALSHIYSGLAAQ